MMHPRSQSLCSNSFSSSPTGGPAARQSLVTIPSLYLSAGHHHQHTLVGSETLIGFDNAHRNGARKYSIGFPKRSSKEAQRLPVNWLEGVFQRRECIKFIPADDRSDRCWCGLVSAAHSQLALSRFTTSVIAKAGHLAGTNADRNMTDQWRSSQPKWIIGTCTAASPTDAYGTVEFQGGTHVHKARYVRLSFDTDPEDIINLMERVWALERPRLVISVHGGTANFNVRERLGRVFREGLLNAAETTGAWVFTSGLDSGVVKHVARALDEGGISARMRSRIVTVGIAPWGMLKCRDQLLGLNSHVPYDRHNPWPCAGSSESADSNGGGGLILNDRHSYFLLADNGTVDRYGADIVLRRRLEEFLARKYGQRSGRPIPIICLALEGGFSTLNSVHQYLHGSLPVPAIICEGSGRVSDLLALAEQHLDEEGNLPSALRSRLLFLIRQFICHSLGSAPNCLTPEAVLQRVVECARHRDGLLTVFRLGDQLPESAQMDRIILRALLHGQNLSPVDQLLLTIDWGRQDIARSELFRRKEGGGHQEQTASGPAALQPDWLCRPMMEALLKDRVDFVRLFLEQGLSPKRFLTFARMEELYNSDSQHTLGTLLAASGGRIKGVTRSRSLTLPEIGAIIERLMGNAFRSSYTTRAFKVRYQQAKFGSTHLRRVATRQFSSLQMCLGGNELEEETTDQGQAVVSSPQRKCALSCVDPSSPTTQNMRSQQPDFPFPFNELMLWAVLTRRHQMALLFWEYGEEPMAKALTAIRLYKCMSREAAHDYTEVEVSNHLRECAQEFRENSLELLHHCHQQDQQMTMRLLTAQLPNWGQHTCLSLAVIANNKRFLAHPCCQILLAELWHGGLRFRSQSNTKVILGILFPPSILLLDFKTPLNPAHLKRETSGGCPLCLSAKGHWTGAAASAGEDGEEDDVLLDGNKGRGRGKRNAEGTGDGTPAEGAGRRAKGAQCCRGREKEQSRLAGALSKFVLFYGAPITSFWVWSISFIAFMLAFIFVLLAEFPSNEVPPLEWLLFVYVLALAMEHFRKLLVLESSSLMEKLAVFYNKYWNILTTVCVLTFFVGFAFRFDPASVHSYSRVILATNSVLWHMKLFDFLSVHPRIGPYITMAGKMVLAMSYIIILLMVTLMGFGVARQSITFPHEKWAWILVRNIFYKPYFMLYGEVYAGEIDTCGDEGTNCVPGHWIPPILMTVFLLIANILLINMLIAIFNNIFSMTNAMSQQIWMFQRYAQLLEYKSTPVLPPPLTPLAHALMILGYLFKRNCSHGQTQNGSEHVMAGDGEFALQVQLSPNELRELQDFEEDCQDDLFIRKCRDKANEEEREEGNRREGEKYRCQESEALLKRLMLRVDGIERMQQRIMSEIARGNDPAASGKQHISEEKMPSRPKKFVPRARVQPISSSAPATDSPSTESRGTDFVVGNGGDQMQLMRVSSPHLRGTEEERGRQTRFTLFEEGRGGNDRERCQEEESVGQSRRRLTNSVSLGEELEQMFDVLRRWTE